MFSGKSEELIRRLRRAIIARQRVQIFKPIIDDRFEERFVVSHSQMRIEATQVNDADQVEERFDPRAEVVGIDEVQFFGARIVDICERFANMGKRVIVAGLDQDYLGRPFEPVPQLMAVAEFVTKTLAVCSVCGAPANRSQRLIESTERVVVGARGSYEARCRRHFDPDATRQRAFDLALGAHPAPGSDTDDSNPGDSSGNEPNEEDE